ASFGQGITVTPLQMVTAFSALANGGKLMKPYIVKRIEYANGKVDEVHPIEVRQVVDKHTADTVAAMMVRVVDYSEGIRGKVPAYYIAGKTGTAQIAGPGGYTAETNHSFIGFGPVDNPKFVMLIRLEKPQRSYANITAAPLFAQITTFLMSYYHIPPER
ncbi:MAG TPA: penicillin-binding transpeptidase domain-containing protein, partial [Candidatus Magasanikbacteria bacterium]|nr:penicillin-binding transpeptidase domain-containing protein [Candidatus Magasanikbacteria bacterium]